ncbi:hypothetical protein C0J52_09464 [Blattella germanica]|nr:hypothetical protein C0J52_09464 [Blattella germanica]
MAGCLNLSQEGNVSPENIKRWTASLTNVLLSSTARRRFSEYLDKQEFTEELDYLRFWEKCDQFLTTFETTKPYGFNLRSRESERRKGSTTGKDEWEKKLIKQSQDILEFADAEVNFDLGELDNICSAVESEDIAEIKTAINDAKLTAANKLEKKYEGFCRHLLTKKGLLKTEN